LFRRVAGIAAILVIPKIFWRVSLSLGLIIIAIFTWITLNSNLKKEVQKDVNKNTQQPNNSPTTVQTPLPVSQSETNQSEINEDSKETKTEKLRKGIVCRWTHWICNHISFTEDGKYVYSTRNTRFYVDIIENYEIIDSNHIKITGRSKPHEEYVELKGDVLIFGCEYTRSKN
jgi:hypothetical protein